MGPIMTGAPPLSLKRERDWGFVWMRRPPRREDSENHAHVEGSAYVEREEGEGGTGGTVYMSDV